jgi:MFS family permease
MLRSVIKAYREAYGGLPAEVWALAAAMLINRTGSMVVSFLTLYLTQRLGWSVSAAGSIFSIYGFGSIAGVYLGGRLLGRLGVIKVQILGLLAAGPCYILVPWFDDWYGVAAAVFLMSLFSEMVRPASNVAIALLTPPEKRTQAYGLQRVAINLGFSIGPAIGGLLTLIDYNWLFWVDGCFSMMGGLFLLSYFRGRPEVLSQATKSPQISPPADASGLTGPGETSFAKGTAGLSPRSDPFFLSFLGLYLLALLVFYQFTVTYPKFMTEHYGLNEPQIGMLYAINTLLIVTLEMLVINYFRKFELLSMIGLGACLACWGFGILPFFASLPIAILAIAVLTFGEMLMMPLATTFVAERSQGKDQGRYMSYYAMTYSLAAITAPFIGANLYEIDRNRIWYFALGIGVVVWTGLICLNKRRYHNLPAASLSGQK